MRRQLQRYLLGVVRHQPHDALRNIVTPASHFHDIFSRSHHDQQWCVAHDRAIDKNLRTGRGGTQQKFSRVSARVFFQLFAIYFFGWRTATSNQVREDPAADGAMGVARVTGPGFFSSVAALTPAAAVDVVAAAAGAGGAGAAAAAVAD